jgi:D-lactate dehydrogenase
MTQQAEIDSSKRSTSDLCPEPSTSAIINQLRKVVGKKYVVTSEAGTRRYRTGFRFGGGPALAVVKPATLVEMWRSLQVCANADTIVIIQAANTGLTGGSTPDGADYDRQIVIINTMRLSVVHPIRGGQQVICLPGSTLFDLTDVLDAFGREPHSVIGSSCIGASVFGGICNNSGGLSSTEGLRSPK